MLDPSDIDRCGYEDGGNDLLLDEEIHVLEFPVQGSQKTIQDIITRGLDQRGAVLVQSPFEEDRYEDITQARELFALVKHMHFSRLCMYLGAREVRIEQVQRITASETKTWNVEGSGSIKISGISTDTSIKKDEQDEFISRLALIDTFDGGQTNLEAAEELLRQKKLLGDPNMSGLLDMRRSESNQLRSRTLTLNLSSETKRNLSVIGKLKVPPFINLEANYKHVIHEKAEYRLTIKVRF